jgi:hypothetical protein
MRPEFNLKKLEKKAWTSTFESGLPDIGIGLILVVTTICQIFNKNSPYLYSLYQPCL